MSKQHRAQGLAPQMLHRLPGTTQMVKSYHTMSKHYSLAVGQQKHFTGIHSLRPGLSKRPDLIPHRLVLRTQSVHYSELRASALNSACQRSMVPQPGAITLGTEQ
jgi:hypothetical protein